MVAIIWKNNRIDCDGRISPELIDIASWEEKNIAIASHEKNNHRPSLTVTNNKQKPPATTLNTSYNHLADETMKIVNDSNIEKIP